MGINLQVPDLTELKPRITVFGVGGAGGNAVNNMIQAGLQGVEFVVANTDAQALTLSKATRVVQMGVAVTEGLGAGSQPEVGRAAAEEVIDEINDHLTGSHMVFITAGMGGGTGTGAAPVVARAARERGILTVGVVTKPFQFEGARRMRLADAGITELQASVDTLIVIPNQNLFRIANERTTFADAFAMADQVLYSGVACITDLMVKEGLINLDFADVRSIMRGMGKAMMGTGEASGDRRALQAAEAAIANPLLDEVSMKGARGLLISITGGKDLTLFEVDEAATRIREEVDQDANIILGATFDDELEGVIRVSVVATGIDHELAMQAMADTKAIETARAAVIKTSSASPAAQTVADIRPATHSLRPVEAPAPAPVQPRIEDALERELMTQATHDPRVMIEPYQQPQHAGGMMDDVNHGEPEMAPVHEPAPQPYVPPQAERPAGPPRMPRMEDFPKPVQQARAQAGDDHEDDRRPMGLLRRIAESALGRSKEGAEHGHAEPTLARQPAPPQARAPQPQPPRQPAPQQSQPRPAAPTAQDYAKQQQRPAQPRMPLDAGYRPATGQLDPQGRQAPMPRSEDDQLEIPAFLRRQTN